MGDADNDTMAGGVDTDMLAFATGFSKDLTTGFTAGTGAEHDLIDFDHTIFANFASVKAAMVQSGPIQSSPAGLTL